MNKIDEHMNIQPGESYSSSAEGFSTPPVQPLAEKSAHSIRPYLESGKAQIVEQLNDTAGALQRAGEQLTNRRSSDLFRMSAEKIGRLGDYLERHEVDELMDDFKTYANRKPWLIMGGAFLVGMAAARFFKASDTSPIPPTSI